MGGHHGAQEDDLHLPVGHPDLHLLCDVAGGHRVAGRAEAHAAEAVDLADYELADLFPQ